MEFWGEIWLIDKVLPNHALINGITENLFATAHQICGDGR